MKPVSSLARRIVQALAESRQAVERPGPGVARQVAARGQALCETDGFADPIDDNELPVSQLTDDHVKTV
jgi:hypothetical protein